MGAWDVGPFDNDGAADWAADIEDAAPADRPGLLLDALRNAADDPDYLEVDDAQAAVAAAAVVAATLPGGDPIDSPYAPDFLLEGGTVPLPADARALAVAALDRVTGADSEWQELWAEAGEDGEAAFAAVAALRAVLAP